MAGPIERETAQGRLPRRSVEFTLEVFDPVSSLNTIKDLERFIRRLRSPAVAILGLGWIDRKFICRVN